MRYTTKLRMGARSNHPLTGSNPHIRFWTNNQIFLIHPRNLTALLLLLVTFLSLTACGKHAKEVTDTRFLLDTVCTIRAGGKNARQAIDAAFEEIRIVQQGADFYDPGSIISTFNEAPAGQAILLDPRTAEIVQTALEICKASNGAFDITIAPVKQLWQFGDASPALPREEELKHAVELVDYTALLYDAQAMTLTKTRPGIQVDLGGAAKGAAADRAAAVLQEAGVDYAVVDLGGNVSVIGSNPKHRDGQWTVGIQKPFAPTGEYGQTLTLSQGSAVTSGTYQRNFTLDGVLYHHILDPATGYPAKTQYDSATVVCNSALMADCLSTACMVLGEEQGRALAQRFDAQVYFHAKEN